MMNHRRILLLLVVLFCSVSIEFPSITRATTVYTKNNGVIQININEHDYPMITNLYVNGSQIIPHNNAGADFQMTGRSPAGNAYNPTQGGDCQGNPSLLSGVIPNWNGNGLPMPASNGILLGVDPRNYNDNGSCPSTGGPILPYNFNFGVALGDGVFLPPQAMVIDMSMQLEANSTAQPILRSASEVPVAFPYTSIMRYAFYSLDGNIFRKLERCDTPVGCTNDTLQWPSNTSVNINTDVNGRAIALATTPNAHIQQQTGFGMAFYSSFTTGMTISHRKGVRGIDLTLIAMVGDVHGGTSTISDSYSRTIRRVMVVGNMQTMRSAISTAKQKITDWGNWNN